MFTCESAQQINGDLYHFFDVRTEQFLTNLGLVLHFSRIVMASEIIAVLKYIGFKNSPIIKINI